MDLPFKQFGRGAAMRLKQSKLNMECGWLLNLARIHEAVSIGSNCLTRLEK